MKKRLLSRLYLLPIFMFPLFLMILAFAPNSSKQLLNDYDDTEEYIPKSEMTEGDDGELSLFSCDPPKVLCQSPKCTNGLYKVTCCHPSQTCKAGCTENGLPYADCI